MKQPKNPKKNIYKNLRISALLCGLLLTAGTAASCALPFIVVRDPEQETGNAETEKTAQAEETDAQTSAESTANQNQSQNHNSAVPVPEIAPGEDQETAAEKYLASLRAANYKKTNVLIAAVGTSAVLGEDTEGARMRFDTLASYRAKSLRAVEKKYSVNFVTFTYTADELYREVLNAYNSDTQYVSDFYFIPPRDVGRYQAKGLLYNLRSLPFTDFSAPYFDTTAVRESSAGYGIYAASGDFTRAPENAYAVYYNRTLYKKLDLSSPYDAVKDGNWTWETLFENAKAAVTLDGVMGDNLTSFSDSVCEELFLASSGLHMTSSRVDATPNIKPNTARIQQIADTLYRNVTLGTTAAAPDEAEALFIKGKQLYYVSTLSHVTEWADIRADWGVLPLPKAYDGQTSYFTYQGGGCVLCVPSVTATPEMTGVLLQALFASGAGSHTDVYLDEVLRYYIRDGESMDMLDLILDSYYTDFSSMFSSGYPGLSAATIGAFHKTLTTSYSFESLSGQTLAAGQREMDAAFPVEQ